MLDSDLAILYGVDARALNQAVARNRKRFPADFMFQLTPGEYESLRSQTVISKKGGSTDDLSQSVMSSLRRRDERFEITDCDIKNGPRWTPLSPLRIHRTRRCHALERPAQLARGRGEYCDYAHFRAAPSS